MKNGRIETLELLIIDAVPLGIIQYLEQVVIIIRYLFWNLYRKNLIAPLLQVLVENNIDICVLAECQTLDIQSPLNQLKAQGHVWKNVSICPVGDIRLIAKRNVSISAIKEEKHYSCYKIIDKDDTQLLCAVHLISGMYKNEDARNSRASNISTVITKIEKTLFIENELKSIIVGDFNLQPYSQGIAGIWGFNATMSAPKARQIYRVVDGVKHYFYYNPMWHIMGGNNITQGTYYSNDDENDLSMFWYSYDEVLLSPYFIDKFVWDSFRIIEETSSYKFVCRNKVDKDNFSDHLPIQLKYCIQKRQCCHR